jgi:dihydroxy-acid dehydratase
MGLSEAEIHQPFVGVATCWNEAAPCNIALNRQAQAVKLGVKQALGTPREFTTITVTDGIAMGHEGMRSSLASREAIADTVELTMRGHCYDALVGLAGCDKSLPGMMMAMVRLNVPSVFIYGGSILPGRFEGRDVTVQDVFEAVGRHQAGANTTAELEALERVACPSAGACGGQFTANTMACVSEAIGLALFNSSGAPAPYESRDQYGVASGIAVMKLLAHRIRPRDIVTREAWRTPPASSPAPAARPTPASTCRPSPTRPASTSTSTTSARSSAPRPTSSTSSPAASTSPRTSSRRRRAGGAEGARRAGLLHEDCLTASGRTVGEELDRIALEADGRVIHPVDAAALDHRGRRRAEGQPRPRGRHREDRRHGRRGARLLRPRPRLRMRGGRLRRGQGPHLPRGRGHRHPQRGPRRAAPACARCSRPPPPSPARAWARRWR